MGSVDTGAEWAGAHTAGSWTALEQGSLIAGRYRLLRPLGSGGSAHVWAARDEALGREVALKALSGVTTQGGHECERLKREARLLAALNHPLITTVFDFAEITEEDGTVHPFLVTELLNGESLSARLKRGPLAPQDAVTVCAQVADALATAHSSGVVHRDVKPGNVMLTPRGAVLLDFGISRRDTDTDLTGQVLIGTPACMAPEQWRGATARPASDVYALGCLLYWCLSGHAPYPDRELPALGMSHLLADPPALPFPGRRRADVDAVYRACVRKEPDDRPSAREVAATLELQARPPSHGTREIEPAPATETLAISPIDGDDQPLAVHRGRRARLAAYFAAAGAVLAASIAVPLTQTGANPAGPAATATGASVSTAPSTAGTPTPARTGAAANPHATSKGLPVNATLVPSRTPLPPAPAPPKTHDGGGHHPGHGKHHGS